MQNDMTELNIQRLPEGGFLVTGRHYQGMVTPFLFASTTIDEALKYIKRKLTPTTK
jgi:hypothetical protein